MPLDDRVLSATHEAGHAVVAYLLGCAVEGVTLAPRDLSLRGVTMVPDAFSWFVLASQKTAAARAAYRGRFGTILAAGPAATFRLTGEYDAAAATRDEEQCRRYVGKDIADFADEALKLLEKPAVWRAVVEVAEKLLGRETLTGAEVHRIVRRHVPAAKPTAAPKAETKVATRPPSKVAASAVIRMKLCLAPPPSAEVRRKICIA